MITEELHRQLLPYLRFRHLFRNVYGFDLEGERMVPLDAGFASVCTRALAELRQFLAWLRQAGDVLNRQGA